MDSSKDGLPSPEAEAARWRELAARIRAVDPEGAQEWVERQWRAVWLLLRHRLGGSATPELARSALCEAVTEVRAGRIIHPADFTAWLRTFAARFHAEQPLESIGEDAARAGLPVAGLVEALRESGHRERQALARYYLEGQTPERISRELDLTASEFQQLRLRIRGSVARKPGESTGRPRARSADVA